MTRRLPAPERAVLAAGLALALGFAVISLVWGISTALKESEALVKKTRGLPT